MAVERVSLHSWETYHDPAGNLRHIAQFGQDSPLWFEQRQPLGIVPVKQTTLRSFNSVETLKGC